MTYIGVCSYNKDSEDFLPNVSISQYLVSLFETFLYVRKIIDILPVNAYKKISM